MVTLYDSFPEFNLYAKSSLIRGLSDPSSEIRENLISYWSSPERLDPNPNKRLQQLLTNLYDLEEEAVWLNNAIYLLLQAARSSDDFERPLFSFQLDCSFEPLTISYTMSGLASLQRQQPITSSVAMLKHMVISASQA